MRHPIVHGPFTPKSARRLNHFFWQLPPQPSQGRHKESGVIPLPLFVCQVARSYHLL